MSAGDLFFSSPLSPPFSFLSRVVSRLIGVIKTRFWCRSGENGQIFRSRLFKNFQKSRYIYITMFIYSISFHMDFNTGLFRRLTKSWSRLIGEEPFQHPLAILGHFMPTIVAKKCCQMVKNGQISAAEEPFSASLGHFRQFHANIYLDF